MTKETKSVTGRSTFTHARLRDTATHIRLLYLEHSEWNDGISCTVREYELEATPPFRAISYTWGNPLPLEHILIDENWTFAVRPNCALALRQYRLYYSSEPVWIDGVCINQDDREEKSKQVQIMGQVYSRAEFVVACLGPHQDDSELLVKAIRAKDYHVDNASEMERLGRAYAAFGLRQYWSRLWIVQEIRLAQEIFLLCGTDIVCTWEALLHWNYRGPVSFHAWRDRAAHLQRLLPLNVNPKSQGLLQNIKMHMDFECTEHRDHLFGVLGISYHFAHCRSPTTVRVKYGGSAMSIITDVVEATELRPRTIYKLEQCVGDFFDLLRFRREDLEWSLNPLAGTDFNLVVGKLSKLNTFQREESKLEAEVRFASESYSEWVHEYIRGCTYIPLDHDGHGQLTTSVDNPYPGRTHRKQTKKRFSFENASQHPEKSTTRLRKVFHGTHQVLGLVCGAIEPGDLLVLSDVPLPYVGRGYTIVIRRYRDETFRIIGVGILDHRSTSAITEGSKGCPGVISIRAENASWCYARMKTRKQDSQEAWLLTIRNAASLYLFRRASDPLPPTPFAEQEISRPNERLRYIPGLFDEFLFPKSIQQALAWEQYSVGFFTEFLRCVVASSPVSAFVYLFENSAAENEHERRREEAQKLERQWKQKSSEKEEQEKRKMEDHYEQERQKHENRLQRARELSGTFLLL